MNCYQVVQQLKYLLQQRHWDDEASSANRVFNANSVVVTIAPRETAFATMISPLALIKPGSATSDPTHDEEPDLLVQSISVLLGVVVPGDAVGENALLGAGRQSNIKSTGRGLLEVEEELYNAIGLLNTANGLEVYNRSKSEAIAELLDDTRYAAYREYSFETLCTSQRFYPPVTRVTSADAAASGDAEITYLIAPIRFDGTGAPRILRVAGATATTDPADAGATVIQAGAGSQALSPAPFTVTDSPGTGQFSYSIWAIYDDSGNAGSVTGLWHYSAVATTTITVT